MSSAVVDDLSPKLVVPDGFESRLATKEDLLQAATAEYEMTPEFVESALGKGGNCLALFDRGRLASFGWYSNKPNRSSAGLVLHFDPSWVHMYKGFTHPDYRGKRLHGIGMTQAVRDCAAQGYQGLISQSGVSEAVSAPPSACSKSPVLMLYPTTHLLPALPAVHPGKTLRPRGGTRCPVPS